MKKAFTEIGKSAQAHIAEQLLPVVSPSASTVELPGGPSAAAIIADVEKEMNDEGEAQFDDVEGEEIEEPTNEDDEGYF